ncbi:hypothetical protein F0562_018560 [Nyssa sinensis]|uniref:PGG domain-containing protein n=1 Tax=Nyssa sinensis TaxID=561372 RepID=A0A5J4ZD28_9ASTE|nr:hypothetical protein F0562_018560 [Nyssa sinensis]
MGRERRLPLHYAAIKGRIHVIKELLSASADSGEEATSQGETALHLAVKNNQLEVLRVLVEHLKQFNKEYILNNKDEHGNTILHLAISTKQHEVVGFLLDEHNLTKGLVDVYSLNKRGLTALDVLLIVQSESGDREIGEILQQAGAMAQATAVDEIQLVTTNNPSDHDEAVTEQRQHESVQWPDYFKYNKIRDSPSEVRNCLLVIAALIATATYQAVLSPPGGVGQDYIESIKNPTTSSTTKPHKAGQSYGLTQFCLVWFFSLYKLSGILLFSSHDASSHNLIPHAVGVEYLTGCNYDYF